MLPLDHVVVHQVKIGMELFVLDAMEVDNGMLLLEIVLVLLEIGMDFHVFNAQLDKDGIQQLYHAHVQITLSGMVYHVWHVLEMEEYGIIN